MKIAVKPLILNILCLCALAACSSEKFMSYVPNRAPDYKESQVSNAIEVPPDLSSASLGDKMEISDLNPTSVANYETYEAQKTQRNSKGFIEVLPELYKVEVKQPQGELPYIVADAQPSAVWQAVSKYWQYQGVRLAINEPKIGVMETDWLTNKSDAPQTGIGGLLNKLIGFGGDSTKDRYRLRFTRNGENQTEVTLLYSSAEQSIDRGPGGTDKEASGTKWTISDNDNQEFQLEMTRRIALFVSGELKAQSSLDTFETKQDSSSPEKKMTESAPASTYANLTTLSDGEPALMITGQYSQAWRVLGIGLDKASFEISESDYKTGTYKVRYAPQTDLKNHSFFDVLWGTKDEPKVVHPEYLIRLSDQGTHAVAIVQNVDGTNANQAQAEALLRTVETSL